MAASHVKAASIIPLTAGLSSHVLEPPGPLHKRTYQACIPCRRRKVRCDLGPVDNPHDPPCVRCRRESKECTFSATRRKRKTEDGDEGLDDGDNVDDDFIARNGRRKSVRAYESGEDEQVALRHARPSLNPGSLSTASPVDSYGLGQDGLYTHYATNPPNVHGDDGQDQQVTNETAAALLQSPINTPGDAFHLLLKASGQSEDIQRQHTTSQSNTQGPFQSSRRRTASMGNYSRTPVSGQPTNQSGYAPNIDPAIAGNAAESRRSSPSTGSINVWSRLRFVRAGWFTAREAIAYIDYYYQYLAPLTPVNPPDLRCLESNPNLLSEEPMLTVTLLTIASRYMKVAGPGAQTRSHMIHEKLWLYLQKMVTRMFWGQEQFGGGFCGAGARRKAPKLVEKTRLRSFGAIESLLLLSDFHPRSMHFPPDDDDEDILAPPEEEWKEYAHTSHEVQDAQTGGESTFAGWTEPALRSDRMSWSLIGFSCALAHELGVFGSFSDGIPSVNGHVKRQGGPLTQHKRADRIVSLLFIYMTQACGRFGFPVMFPNHITEYYMSSMSDGFSSVDTMMLENQSHADLLQQYWIEIACINKACNNSLFPSKDEVTQLIQNGDYIVRLQRLQPVLRSWQERLEKSNVSKYPKILLSIEVHYFRLYVNGLALQAVLEQWTTKFGGGSQTDSPQSPESTSSSFSNLYTRNELYIKEVIDSARTVLRHVVIDLLPNDYLKHAPVRAYFRIVSAAMFLLKTFSVGARKIEVDISLNLLDQTISALRTSVVDDVHLCLRIADLLECLTSSIRHKFVRFTPQKTDTPRLSSIDFSPNRLTNTGHSIPPSPSRPGNNIRYIRHHRPESRGQDSTASYLNGPDSNITVMPPPRSIYTPNTTHTQITHPTQSSSQYDLRQQPQQQQQQPTHPQDSSSSSSSTYPFSAQQQQQPILEDWLALDLNPLLGSNNDLGEGQDWFLSFGPETHNNLEVLGKLVNEGWMPGDMPF